MRVEFGQERSVCDCYECTINCHFIPGFLIPSDLDRIVPETHRTGYGPFHWARENLMASPGAVMIFRGKMIRIGTLVPRTATGSQTRCHWLDPKTNLCQIHEIAPFGCAFFKHDSDDKLLKLGIREIMIDMSKIGIYTQIWIELVSSGKMIIPVEKRLALMDEFLRSRRKLGEFPT